MDEFEFIFIIATITMFLIVGMAVFSVVKNSNTDNRLANEKEMFCLKQGFEDFASFEDGVEYCVKDNNYTILKSSCVEGITIFGQKHCEYYLFK